MKSAERKAEDVVMCPYKKLSRRRLRRRRGRRGERSVLAAVGVHCGEDLVMRRRAVVVVLGRGCLVELMGRDESVGGSESAAWSCRDDEVSLMSA